MTKGIQKFILIAFVFFISVGFINFGQKSNKKTPDSKWNKDTPVAQVIKDLGGKLPDYYLTKVDDQQIERGQELVFNGKTIGPDGKKTKVQSKYFTCISCHNTVREDFKLTSSDPQKRLEYAVKNDIPLLQATTFFGIVNRESYYNDDYIKKYGDLVHKAKKSLRESIKLCSTECSQGRELDDWEVEAIVSYMMTLELKLGDLDLTDADWKKLSEASQNPENHADMIPWLKSKYALKSPATFVDPPKDRKAGYGLEGNAENGKLVYTKSCLWCHQPNGVASYLPLEDNKLSKAFLKGFITKYDKKSIYHIIRYGTDPIPGHKPYMPHYTMERMSNQQVEDLRAYLTNHTK